MNKTYYPLKLVYIMSLRNAAADKAGQMIPYKGSEQYMKSPLEFLVECLHGELGKYYELKKIIYDDDPFSSHDKAELKEHGFSYDKSKSWFFPKNLTLPNGTLVVDSMIQIPSTFRKIRKNSPQRLIEKEKFENTLLSEIDTFKPDVILLDGLLLILEKLVSPDSQYFNKILNIHPGITRKYSKYQRRGLHATLDALFAAKGQKIVDWTKMTVKNIQPIFKTGASLHYVDKNIDSGKVIYDKLNTKIDVSDTIFELRWKNFNHSVFPVLKDGLLYYAQELYLQDKTREITSSKSYMRGGE